jgi:hypothetical protein
VVIHDQQNKNTQLFDMKLPDYSLGLLRNGGCKLGQGYFKIPNVSNQNPAITQQSLNQNLVYISDLIREEEKKSPDETYTKPVSRYEGTVIIDPAADHLLPEAMSHVIEVQHAHKG